MLRFYQETNVHVHATLFVLMMDFVTQQEDRWPLAEDFSGAEMFLGIIKHMFPHSSMA